MQRRSLVDYTFFGVVCLSAFPLGSNRDWAWTALAAVIGLLLMVEGGAFLFAANRRPQPVSGLLMPLTLFIGVICWAAWQIAGLGPESQSYPLYHSAAEALRVPVAGALSANVDDGRHAILKFATYGGAFLLAVGIFRDSDRAHRFLILTVVTAIVVTGYGLMQTATGSCVVFEFEKGTCALSGTFVNSNSYASYAGLAGLICLALLARQLLRVANQSNSGLLYWHDVAQAFSLTSALSCAALVFLCGGMLLATSRAGMAAFCIAALTLTALIVARRRLRKSATLQLLAAVTAVGLMVFSLAGAAVTSKFLSMTNENIGERLELWKVTTRAIQLSPWTGWGFGSFETISAFLQPPELFTANDKAHSTPLETIADLGVPVALAVFLMVLLVGLRCWRGVWIRQRNIHLPALGVAGGVMAVGHSLVDFNLQIPAVALLFATLLGLGWAQSTSSRSNA